MKTSFFITEADLFSLNTKETSDFPPSKRVPGSPLPGAGGSHGGSLAKCLCWEGGFPAGE